VSHTFFSSPPFFFFLRNYNFRALVAFPTNSFHLSQFWMQSFQFLFFLYHLNHPPTHLLFLPCCCLLHHPNNHGTKKNIILQNYTTIQLNTLLRQYTIPFYVIFSQPYFSLENIMHNFFIFHIPLGLWM
jgi:hypothetical protein